MSVIKRGTRIHEENPRLQRLSGPSGSDNCVYVSGSNWVLPSGRTPSIAILAVANVKVVLVDVRRALLVRTSLKFRSFRGTNGTSGAATVAADMGRQ